MLKIILFSSWPLLKTLIVCLSHFFFLNRQNISPPSRRRDIPRGGHLRVKAISEHKPPTSKQIQQRSPPSGSQCLSLLYFFSFTCNFLFSVYLCLGLIFFGMDNGYRVSIFIKKFTVISGCYFVIVLLISCDFSC